jgi:hypothetical protein
VDRIKRVRLLAQAWMLVCEQLRLNSEARARLIELHDSLERELTHLMETLSEAEQTALAEPGT